MLCRDKYSIEYLEACTKNTLGIIVRGKKQTNIEQIYHFNCKNVGLSAVKHFILKSQWTFSFL